MLKKWISGATLSLVMVALTACGSKQTTTQNGVLGVEPVAIHSRVTGSSDKLTEPAVYLINDATTLENIGAKQLSDINVDFDTQSLVVLSLGQCPTGGYWAHIDGVQILGETIIVQGTANKPDGTTTQALTFPFEAAVVSKVRGTPVPDISSVEGQDHPSDDAAADNAAQDDDVADQTTADKATTDKATTDKATADKAKTDKSK